MEQIKKGALWVFCEVQAGQLLPVGLQLLGRAKVLAAESSRSLYAVVLGEIPQGGAQMLCAAGADEVITISHTAYSKAVFGKGAIQAAKFLKGKPAGLYNMSNVIEA